MLKKQLLLVLVTSMVLGRSWAADPNPMEGIDDELLLGRPKPAASAAPAARTNPASEADAAPFEDVTAVEADELDPYAADAPVSPLEPTESDVSMGGTLTSYSFLPGDTLRKALERWAREAGYSVVWRADVDFNVDIEMTYPRGTSFEAAAEQTLGAFWRRGAELTGTLYRNKVLVVTERTKA